MTLSAYDLQSALNKKFTVSFESEQEIEIQAEEVVINSDASVDGEIEEINEDIEVADEASDNIEEVDEAVTTLESLIYSMESSVLTGGFDKRNAALANISLESITTKFDLETTLLSFGMEEVEDDGEAETKSTIGKAKQMLSALKSNSGALLNKMYAAAASALGNNAALSAKLIAKATNLKSNVNSENTGGSTVKLSRSVKRKLTLDGKTVLSPDAYVKELQRLTSKYNNVVKTYADTDMLGSFVSDVVKGMNGATGEPKSSKAIVSSVKSISDGIGKSISAPEGVEAAESAPYLGGARIVMKRPTTKSIVDLLDEAVKKQQVSQEGLGTWIKGDLKHSLGSLIFGLGLSGAFLTGGAALMTIGGGLTAAGVAQGALVTSILGFVSYHGLKKGVVLMADGIAMKDGETAKLAAAVRDKVKGKSKEIAAVSTEFQMDNTAVSMEASEDATVTSLSAKQIQQVADIVQNTSTTTQTMKGQLNKRKSIIKNIDQLTKAMAAENKDGNHALSDASALFVKRFIKQTIKFEMQLTSYSVQVMKAALAYAEASNSASPAEEPAEEPAAE